MSKIEEELHIGSQADSRDLLRTLAMTEILEGTSEGIEPETFGTVYKGINHLADTAYNLGRSSVKSEALDRLGEISSTVAEKICKLEAGGVTMSDSYRIQLITQLVFDQLFVKESEVTNGDSSTAE